MSEHSEQQALIEWASTRQGVMPELEYLFAVPNAARRSRYERGQKLSEGLKRGVPDLMLPCARHDQHGLWLELKYGHGKVTADQARWHAWLEGQGYMVEVCHCWQDAASLIEWYLDVPKEQRTEFYH